ncbi:unnamed protein product [Rhizophagus irregularis]|uniref:Uncharacterized protein n=1 Tax=Rhizophagus irregularis TaxID=588596 RepID=A0A916E0E6_9GLOM|nr:unnamed protein product [Rhizophagus irregularis]
MNVDVRSKNLAKGRKFLVIAIIVMENCEDEALSIIQETSEQDITENIELPQVNVDVHQTSTSGSGFGRYTESQRLQIPGT